MTCYIVHAVSPTSTVVSIMNDVHTTISNTNARDTLSGADTTILIEDLQPDAGYEHILVMTSLTGTASDTVNSMILIQSKDNNGITIKVDSITIQLDTSTQGFTAHVIPFDGTKGISPAGRFRVSLVTLAGTGAQVISNKAWLMRRRTLTARTKND